MTRMANTPGWALILCQSHHLTLSLVTLSEHPGVCLPASSCSPYSSYSSVCICVLSCVPALQGQCPEGRDVFQFRSPMWMCPTI